MYKEFVPYQESLELKELGFDEPCFGEYRTWDSDKPWLQIYQHLDGCSTDPADYEYTSKAKAPLYQQAFRWFREEHNLMVTISHVSVHGWFYRVLEKNSGWYGGNVKYEDTELACLRKLIEIVKEKQK